ncbi:Hypothetical protein GbCGDNIH9_8663 [Granulibacter bethesdensis]|uniref:Uncharacterized protein n=1 Tax=Granulibacter bethesdensis TaxID=364410 RepID=A0AAC9KDM9_9PROT|nr:Hypothetical protein GbCGDNIH9_8663 [Granulibacter bethesdensis]APH62747.1 Hypothetical protein GbCGDNIH8_8663 [Granulibacter bethesdensis]
MAGTVPTRLKNLGNRISGSRGFCDMYGILSITSPAANQQEEQFLFFALASVRFRSE